jgi:hypothetical protein
MKKTITSILLAISAVSLVLGADKKSYVEKDFLVSIYPDGSAVTNTITWQSDDYNMDIPVPLASQCSTLKPGDVVVLKLFDENMRFISSNAIYIVEKPAPPRPVTSGQFGIELPKTTTTPLLLHK